MQRKKFIKNVALGVGGFCAMPHSLFSMGTEKKEPIKLVILHTNDQHSRIDPFPMDGGKFQGNGGVAKRASLIDDIRAENEHVLLLDCGDIFQGTPYFNLFNGELEMKLMSKLGYDLGTMGNHDFDIGIEGFENAINYANFPFVVSNYDFSKTPLRNKVKPFHIIKKGPIKIGFLGLGIRLEGLVPDSLCEGVVYQDPIAKAREVSKYLKEQENCDLVICLSHLGYLFRNPKLVCDLQLAVESHDIDIILGGHTHTFLDQPTILKNQQQNQVIVNQAGWAGLVLGRIDINFEYGKRPSVTKLENKNL